MKEPICYREAAKDKKWTDATEQEFDANSDKQIEGKDYKATFSPVAKFATLRILMVSATSRNWKLHQLDINSSFLHGKLDEDIYIKMPEGYKKGCAGNICKLKRSLFGLKQASR